MTKPIGSVNAFFQTLSKLFNANKKLSKILNGCILLRLSSK